MIEKKLIQTLGFTPKENTSGIFYKKYNSYAIEINFEKNQFDFGKKITAGRETTQNFSQQENWVILECVDRLLEKGYKPENIILEKKYKVGHGASGGWLDILVTRDDGSAYLMIECKTWGKEFDKEFKNLEKNGGQLFTYFQQDKNADILMLYTSKLDKNKIQFRNEIIKIEGHYRQAGNVEDVFDRWNKLSNTNGIFNDWVKPYLFESKKLTKKDLKPLNEEDSKKIFHAFSSILRKHSVSDKPNAFNKIFNLFLAKIFDEKKRDNKELDFQWKEHKDNAVDFQIRLINLYKSGMYDFLEKEIKGISDDMFSYKTQEELLERKKHILLLDKIFDIKEVFDNETFEDNHKVLKEVVQLLQKYQIRYPGKQQHLSDFFERLLTTGLKQEAGQFFTPPPITRFIVRSLPISQYIAKQLNQPIPELPAAIDYSVGSGHFLTEVMEEYQRAIEQDIDTSKLETDDAETNVNAWKIKKYDWASKYIYGIEKDYRLVKVAKVGCYFYGDGLAQVIHGDGLDNFKNSKNYRGLLKKNAAKPQFSFIVSNPPYSVSSFKGDLKNTYANKDFELFDSLTDRSSEIECLFVERTRQLLKTNGIAAIILPSSILNNSGIYTQAREIILKSFDLIAIAELGSATFMATGTKTVTLFLKRREDAISKQIEKALTTFFTNHKDITINGIEKPIAKYVAHVWDTISFEDYKTLLQKAPNANIEQHEIYKEYTKNIKPREHLSADRQQEELCTAILAIEQEKLLYFILAYPQKLVLVKTGDKKEEKRFLGYEFSNRRGSEGIHPIQKGLSIDECTHLYDANTFDNPEKASTYIYKAFTESKFDLEIPETLQKNVSYQNLIDMLTFDRADFEKKISLSTKKKVKIESKWDVVRIKDLCEIGRGRVINKKEIEQNKGDYPIYSSQTSNNGIFGYINTYDFEGEYATWTTDGIYAGSVFYRKGKFNCTNVCGTLKSKSKNLSMKYLALTLPNYTNSYVVRVANPKLMNNVMAEIKIPLPPLDIQQKIVAEIEVLEKQEQKAVEEIESLKSEISNSINELYSTNDILKLKDIFSINSKSTNPKTTYKEKYFTYIDIESLENGTGKITYRKKVLGNEAPSRAKRIAENDSTIISTVRPYLKGFAYIEKVPDDVIFSTGYAILKSNDDSKYLTKLLYYFFMYSDNLMKQMEAMMPKAAYPSINKSDIESLKIPSVKIDKQTELINLFKNFELKITQLEKEIADIPKQKETILKKHLE